MLSRLATRSELKRRLLARSTPATYVVFDQLYERYRSLLKRPLWQRRQHLERTVNLASERKLVVSDGVCGKGKAFFQEVAERGLEGVVAKHLESRYSPGSRSDAWLKIKRRSA